MVERLKLEWAPEQEQEQEQVPVPEQEPEPEPERTAFVRQQGVARYHQGHVEPLHRSSSAPVLSLFMYTAQDCVSSRSHPPQLSPELVP